MIELDSSHVRVVVDFSCTRPGTIHNFDPNLSLMLPRTEGGFHHKPLGIHKSANKYCCLNMTTYGCDLPFYRGFILYNHKIKLLQTTAIFRLQNNYSIRVNLNSNKVSFTPIFKSIGYVVLPWLGA